MTLVEGDLKAPFSIVTTARCGGGAIPFPGLLYFTLDTYLILVLSKEVSSTIFQVSCMTRPRIETRSLRPLANTLPTRLLIYIYIYIHIYIYKLPPYIYIYIYI